MEIRVRAAEHADVGRVLDFWKEAAAVPSVSDDDAGVTRLLDRDPGALMLAEDDGGIAGTIIAGWDGWRGQIYRLAVRPDRRRQGLASALVAAAETRLVGLGARKIQGIVMVASPAAQTFWAAVGYAWDTGDQRHTKTLR